VKTIQIQPDACAEIASRLAARLRHEGIFPANPNRSDAREYERAIEALADELHTDIIDRMLGAGVFQG
jgi:hypothetical protein